MISLDADNLHSGSAGKKFPGCGCVQAGSVDFHGTGRTQRGHSSAFPVQPVLQGRHGGSGAAFRVAQDERAFAQPSFFCAAVGQEDHRADKQENQEGGAQAPRKPVVGVGQYDPGNFQNDTQCAGNAEPRDERFQNLQARSDDVADDHDQKTDGLTHRIYLLSANLVLSSDSS